MTDGNKEGPGTVAELRVLLDKATPGPWDLHESDHIRHETPIATVGGPDEETVAECWGKPAANAALIAALRNAAPDLLRVVEAVAAASPIKKHSDGYVSIWLCGICEAEHTHWTEAGRFPHKPGCAWVLADKLTGGA